MGNRQLDDDRLALMRATSKETIPSQAQGGPFTGTLVLASAFKALIGGAWRIGRSVARQVRARTQRR